MALVARSPGVGASASGGVAIPWGSPIGQQQQQHQHQQALAAAPASAAAPPFSVLPWLWEGACTVDEALAFVGLRAGPLRARQAAQLSKVSTLEHIAAQCEEGVHLPKVQMGLQEYQRVWKRAERDYDAIEQDRSREAKRCKLSREPSFPPMQATAAVGAAKAPSATVTGQSQPGAAAATVAATARPPEILAAASTLAQQQQENAVTPFVVGGLAGSGGAAGEVAAVDAQAALAPPSAPAPVPAAGMEMEGDGDPEVQIIEVVGVGHQVGQAPAAAEDFDGDLANEAAAEGAAPAEQHDEQQQEEQAVTVMPEVLFPGVDLGIPANSDEELAVYQDMISRPVATEDKEVSKLALSSIPLTYRSLRTLGDNVWLNDDIMNGSLGLMQERDWRWSQNNHHARPANMPHCHFFNTFFLNKLYKDKGMYVYKEVQRWTRKPKLTSYGQAQPCVLLCDRLFFPVHVGTSHWAAACIDLQRRRLHYWDSLNRSCAPQPVLAHLAQWVVDEAKDKLPADQAAAFADALTWPRDVHKDVPQQLPSGVDNPNTCDCGVFAILFIAMAGTGRAFNFSQQDIPTARRRLLHDLVKLVWNLT